MTIIYIYILFINIIINNNDGGGRIHSINCGCVDITMPEGDLGVDTQLVNTYARHLDSDPNFCIRQVSRSSSL